MTDTPQAISSVLDDNDHVYSGCGTLDGKAGLEFRGRQVFPAQAVARARHTATQTSIAFTFSKIASNIAAVSRPVCVFWRLG